jgi:hypothetical protein
LLPLSRHRGRKLTVNPSFGRRPTARSARGRTRFPPPKNNDAKKVWAAGSKRGQQQQQQVGRAAANGRDALLQVNNVKSFLNGITTPATADKDSSYESGILLHSKILSFFKHPDFL